MGQLFYLCDSVVCNLMYELMVKQFGKTLSGKEKRRDESNIKLILGSKLQPTGNGSGTH